MAGVYSDFQPGDKILFLNESDQEHPHTDVGEIVHVEPPYLSDFGDQVPLTYEVWPSDPNGGTYIVQCKDVLGSEK